MQPNANLNLLHCVGFTAALIAIFGWGLVCLEAELARQQPRTASVSIAAAE